MSGQIITADEDVDQNVIVNYYQDVEPHLKDAALSRRLDSENRTAFGRRAEFRRTMTIPFNVMMQVCEKLGIPAGNMFDRDAVRRVTKELKGSDYKLFRTTADRRI